MIFCPICGTANRTGSKYCNECGIKFSPQMRVKCPACGTANLADDLQCGACGARLSAPPIPHSEISSPEEREAGHPVPPRDAEEVPTWLQGLPARPTEETLEEAPSQPEDIPDDASDEGYAGVLVERSEDGAEVQQPIKELAPPTEILGSAIAAAPDAVGDGADGGGSKYPALSVTQVGILAGIPDALPVEALIARPRIATASMPSAAEDGPLAAAVSQARLFAEIVAPPPDSTSEAIAQAESRWPTLLPRWAIYAVLIAAVTFPLLLRSPLLQWVPGLRDRSFVVPRSLETVASVTSLYDQIESLDAEATVLVAFDYDPATVGEMDILAGAIARHLMAREARLVAISLLPAGAPTAQRLLEMVAVGEPGYSDGYGQRYANLGYLPGGSAAVRLLGHSVAAALPHDFQGNSLRDLEVMEGITSVRDFDLIIELGATQEALRLWIEQASTPYDVLLGAGVSAAVEPLARPYYEAEPRQLVGLVSGVPGAAMYETIFDDQRLGAGMVARLDAQLAGHVVLLLIIVVGNGLYWARRATGKAH